MRRANGQPPAMGPGQPATRRPAQRIYLHPANEGWGKQAEKPPATQYVATLHPSDHPMPVPSSNAEHEHHAIVLHRRDAIKVSLFPLPRSHL